MTEKMAKKIERIPDKPMQFYDKVDDLFKDLSTQEKEEKQEIIYENYRKAMEGQKLGLEPLPEDRFIQHFFYNGNYKKTVVFGCDSKYGGYVFGNDIDGVFVPSHIAPNDMWGSLNLSKQLAKAERPVVAAIPEHMIKMAKKLDVGWKITNISILQRFRENPMPKTIVTNNYTELLKLGTKLAQDEIKRRVRQFGEKIQQSIDPIIEKAVEFLSSEDDMNGNTATLFNNHPKEESQEPFKSRFQSKMIDFDDEDDASHQDERPQNTSRFDKIA